MRSRPCLKYAILAALWLGCSPAMAHQAGRSSTGWPEVPTVQDWLAQELRQSRPGAAQPGQPAPPKSVAPKAAAIELVAVFGTQAHRSVHVRIGGHVHILLPSGPGRADDARGKDSIVADQFEGRCLRLRYRSTTRRLCLSRPPDSAGAQ